MPKSWKKYLPPEESKESKNLSLDIKKAAELDPAIRALMQEKEKLEAQLKGAVSNTNNSASDQRYFDAIPSLDEKKKIDKKWNLKRKKVLEAKILKLEKKKEVEKPRAKKKLVETWERPVNKKAPKPKTNKPRLKAIKEFDSTLNFDLREKRKLEIAKEKIKASKQYEWKPKVKFVVKKKVVSAYEIKDKLRLETKPETTKKLEVKSIKPAIALKKTKLKEPKNIIKQTARVLRVKEKVKDNWEELREKKHENLKRKRELEQDFNKQPFEEKSKMEQVEKPVDQQKVDEQEREKKRENLKKKLLFERAEERKKERIFERKRLRKLDKYS